MAIAVSQLDIRLDTSPGATSELSNSVAYTAGNVYLVAVTQIILSGVTPDVPTLSGWSTTWTQVSDRHWSTGAGTNRRTTCFTGTPSGSGTAALTYSYATQPSDACITILEITGGSETVVQSVDVATANSFTSATLDEPITMATPGSVDNRFLAFVAMNVNNTDLRLELDADTGGEADWTSFTSAGSGSSPSSRHAAGWLNADPNNDLTPGHISSTLSGSAYIICFEIQAGATAQTWTGSTGAVSAAGTAGSFTAGAITWAGSTGAVTATGTAGVFTAGPQTWAASTGTVTATGTAGSFTPGATTWTGSTAAVTATGSVGSFPLLPRYGAWWGTSPGSGGSGGASPAGLTLWEGFADREAAIVHVYNASATWTGIPTANETTMFAGSIPFYNWKPGGSTYTWQQVADGANDTVIATVAQNLASLNRNLFLAIQHEPDNDTAGDPDAAAYRAMFRHVVELMRSEGATSVSYVWNMTGYSGQGEDSNGKGFNRFWPGDDVVDWVASNPYQLASLNDFDEMMVENASAISGWPGFYAWATTAKVADSNPSGLDLYYDFGGGKWLMLAEWGNWFDLNSDADAAAFITSIGTQAPSYPKLRAFVQFNVDLAHINHIDGYTLSEAAYSAVGNLPYFMEGAQTWAGSTGVVTATGAAGSFTGAAQTWSGSTGAVTGTGTAGSFSAGTSTWTGPAGEVTISGVAGSFSAYFDPQTWTGSTAETTATGSPGSFSAGVSTWEGGIGTASAVGASGSFSAGVIAWTASTGAITVSGTAGSFTAGGEVWQGSTGALSSTGGSGSFSAGTATWAGTEHSLSVTGIAGAFSAGETIWGTAVRFSGLAKSDRGSRRISRVLLFN